MYSDDELLPISALQHLLFCERQCALIHIEQAWAENRWTAEGHLLHERVHEAGDEARGEVRVARGLRLRSLRLGLVGQSDVVEFRRMPENAGGGVELSGASGRWQPFPVEYKRGRPKGHDADRIQLCAQAMCLEEMTAVRVETGALFYGELRRRQEVDLDQRLRDRVVEVADAFHRMMRERHLPTARWSKHCRACSLLSVCQPRSTNGPHSDAYRKELLG